MSTAARMRKYRARKKLREALVRARDAGVDVAQVIDEYVSQRNQAFIERASAATSVTPIGVTPTARDQASPPPTS